jgi:hypothetical protein
LDFGRIVPSQTLGTITVDKDGHISNTGGARYIPNTGAKHATLSISGEAGQNVTIEADATATITNSTNDKMIVAFIYGTLPNKIGGDGKVALNYGGTLIVAANQASGIYSGTYNVYVTYVA